MCGGPFCVVVGSSNVLEGSIWGGHLLWQCTTVHCRTLQATRPLQAIVGHVSGLQFPVGSEVAARGHKHVGFKCDATSRSIRLRPGQASVVY